MSALIYRRACDYESSRRCKPLTTPGNSARAITHSWRSKYKDNSEGVIRLRLPQPLHDFALKQGHLPASPHPSTPLFTYVKLSVGLGQGPYHSHAPAEFHLGSGGPRAPSRSAALHTAPEAGWSALPRNLRQSVLQPSEVCSSAQLQHLSSKCRRLPGQSWAQIPFPLILVSLYAWPSMFPMIALQPPLMPLKG